MSIIRTQSRFTTRRLAIDAVILALYFALSLVQVTVGGIRITFKHLAVIISALIYGPVDGLLVGGLGEMLSQMMSYGFTPTTLLWMLPTMVQGLLLGLCTSASKKKLGLDAVLEKPVPVGFFIACGVTGVVSSCLNTFAYYVDAKMFGYYVYELVFGVFWLRLGIGIISSIVLAMAAKLVVIALRQARFI